MAGRPRTVISPPPAPRATKAKPDRPKRVWAPRPGEPGWRVREPGEVDPKQFLYCGTYEDAEGIAGPGSIIEVLTATGWGRRPRLVPTVLELAEQGMAREVAAPGGSRWELSDLGQQVLHDAMMGVDE